jgi:hypothetical protein
MNKPPKTLTLYQVHRHNLGVLCIEFTFRKTTKGSANDCHIYQAECPYGEEKRITVSYDNYNNYGYYIDVKTAKNKCVSNQKEQVEILENRLKSEIKQLNKLKANCPVMTEYKD